MLVELGRIVYDVELKAVGDGKKVVNNALAIQRGKNLTTFIEFEAWDQTAERIAKYYKKGYEILLQGQLVNKKKKKGEQEFQTVAIVVDKMFFTHGNPKNKDIEKEMEEE